MHDSSRSPRHIRTLGPRLALAGGLVIALGCAHGGTDPNPSATETEAPTTQSPFGTGASDAIEQAAAEASANETTEDEDAVPPVERKSSEMIVIDSGEAADRAPTLAEASARAKRQQREGGQQPSVAVINNDNLSDYASRGSLTFAEPDEPTAADEALQAEAAGAAEDETYWRGEARRIRETWRDAVDEIDDLEGEVGKLRTRFYAEDDPYIRDNRIKPAWDRALDRLSQARTRAEASQDELEDFLDRGRREGARPGWLREGIELEPEIPEEDSSDDPIRGSLGALEPIEPITSEEDSPP